MIDNCPQTAQLDFNPKFINLIPQARVYSFVAVRKTLHEKCRAVAIWSKRSPLEAMVQVTGSELIWQLVEVFLLQALPAPAPPHQRPHPAREGGGAITFRDLRQYSYCSHKMGF